MKFLAHRAKSIIVVLAMSLGIVATTAVPAYASAWATSDGFEANPGATWGFFNQGVGSGGFEYGIGSAYEGQGNAWLEVTTGWSSISKLQRVTPALVHNVKCWVGFVIQPWGGATVNLEVIDPKTWTYIALNTVYLPGYSYTQTAVGPFYLNATSPNQPDVVVRVSQLEKNGIYHWVRIDNYSMYCEY
jgi:hypothetical protein